MEEINYGHFTGDTQLLGPFRRGVLWVQGCCFSCKGCIAQSMRGEGGYWIETKKMAEFFLQQLDIEGITISGGEPFLQPKALTEMIRMIRQEKDFGVIVYSGLYLKEIEKLSERNEWVKDFLTEIDLLIDGRYEEELDDGRKAVGSSNQTIHLLTDRYKESAAKYYTELGRKTEIRVFGNRMQMIGVPSAESADVWRALVGEKDGKKQN